MTVSPLRAHLDALQLQAADHTQALTTDLATRQAARARLQAETAALQQQLEELDAACAQLEADLAAPANLSAQEFAAVTNALAANASDLKPLAVYWTARAQFRQQRATLLAAQPDWEPKLQDYRTFAANPTAALEALPTSYRAAMQTAHEQLRIELAPYLDLETAEHSLVPPTSASLQVVVVLDTSEAQIYWLLPIPSTNNIATEESAFWGTLMELLTAAIQSLANHSDWVVADLTVETWDCYTLLHALAEYGGAAPLTTITKNLFAAALKATPMLEGIVLTVEADELSLAAGQLGVTAQPPVDQRVATPPTPPELTAPTEVRPVPIVAPTIEVLEKLFVAEASPADAVPPPPTPVPSRPEVLITASTMIVVPTPTNGDPHHASDVTAVPIPTLLGKSKGHTALIGDSQGWYTEADLVAWDRPTKVGEASRWNTQARRLRTVLIRLAVHGKVGSTGVPSAMLWEPLPEPHRSAVRSSIDALITKQVLRIVSGKRPSDRQVALNPAQMTEVQSLINRQVTPFWSDVLNIL